MTYPIGLMLKILQNMATCKSLNASPIILLPNSARENQAAENVMADLIVIFSFQPALLVLALYDRHEYPESNNNGRIKSYDRKHANNSILNHF